MLLISLCAHPSSLFSGGVPFVLSVTARCSLHALNPAYFALLPPSSRLHLSQDGTFAREFARCLGALLTKAPSPSLDLLLGGACALHDELHWFAVRGCGPSVLQASHARALSTCVSI